MAYGTPTARQRSKMIDLSQEGRVTFAGPRASDGMIVAVRGRAGALEAYYVTRSGRVLGRAEAGSPDPREFDVLPMSSTGG